MGETGHCKCRQQKPAPNSPITQARWGLGSKEPHFRVYPSAALSTDLTWRATFSPLTPLIRVIKFPREEAHKITKLHDLFPQIHRCSLDCWYFLQTNRLLYPRLQKNVFLCWLPSLQILVVTFQRLIFRSTQSHLLCFRCLNVFLLRNTTQRMPLMVTRSARWLYLISYLFTADV